MFHVAGLDYGIKVYAATRPSGLKAYLVCNTLLSVNNSGKVLLFLGKNLDNQVLMVFSYTNPRKNKMTLQQIESGLRPQFIWESSGIWKTSKEHEGSRQIGMAVFVGIATLHHFTPTEICQYLFISQEQYDLLWSKYRQQIKQACSQTFEPLKNPFNGFTHAKSKKAIEWETFKQLRKKKIFTKSTLVQSFLVHQYGAGKICFKTIQD